ncbi:MAG: nucleotide exchange factor GrpE [Catenisphaera adipataccumulans]|jgi:molecular chaperone GrpE|uniref:nucleotide exchange factor GrpE n=1 Tax=Catenisphaera adipataccumulans TaxID=700500 RepID=UPI003D9275CC
MMSEETNKTTETAGTEKPAAEETAKQASEPKEPMQEDKSAKKEKKKDKKEKKEKKAKKTKDDSAEVIQKLQEALKQAQNDRARAYADAENMKKRLQKEADNAKKYRFQDAALNLLPIVDSMGMALNVQTDNEEIKNYVKGFEMIYRQLQQVLENEGVKEIEAEGKAFDHNTMQALMQEKQEGVESGMVIEVMQKGYMLKDRILRPALVKVSE